MNRTKIYVTCIILLGVFTGTIGLSGAIKKKKPKYIWRMGTVAPNAAYLSDTLQKEFIDRFENITDGELTIDMFWGGTMGDEEDYIAKMHIEQLQGCILSVGGVLMACPEMGVLQIPFLFNNYDEVAYIKKKLIDRFDNIYKKNGFKLLAWIDQDFDQIYSTKYEMRNPDDFRNSKFLTHAGEVEKVLIQELGGSPIPVGVPEAVTAFRSGVCNAAISPALWWLGSQLYTITKYVNAYPFRYSPACLVVSLKAWNELPEKHRKSVTIELKKLEHFANKMVHDMNEKCLKAMIKYGVKEVKMTPEEIEVFKIKTKSMGEKLAGKLYPRELMFEIQNNLKKYRTRKAKKKNINL